MNPPITFYPDDAPMGYDEDQFMKTMRILTTSYNEPQKYDDGRPKSLEKNIPVTPRKQRSNSTVKKPSPMSKKELSTLDSEDEDEDILDCNGKSTLTKEDKRRRNTAASARFRVKKKNA